MPGIVLSNFPPVQPVYGPPAPTARKPRKVTPATVKGAQTGSYSPEDVFYSFRGFTDALSYWMPAFLNQSVATARTFRQLVS